MTKINLQYLLDQYVSEIISEEDFKILWSSLQQEEYAEQWLALSTGMWENEALHPIEDPQKRIVFERLHALTQGADETMQTSLHANRTPFLRRWWWAAAAMLAVVVGTFLWTAEKKSPDITHAEIHNTHIQPGKEGAILTLADGSQVVLDSSGNGLVARQSGGEAVLRKGELVYEAGSGQIPGEVAPAYNTITTPKGRQFSLTLSDGTKVWLNAASSLRYPTIFSGEKRQVEVTGEAYFEVMTNKQQPFLVNINNQAEIKVLGTQFNVNAYTNEASIHTTLIEGSVKVISFQTESSDRPEVVLQPGQQARIVQEVAASGAITTKSGITVVQAEIDRVTAWKKGLFDFRGMGLQEVMRQLERWYDIEVVYEKGIPDIRFGGELSRGVSLAGVLKGLEESGVHFKVEGRRLLVTSY